VQHITNPGVTPYIRQVVFESSRPAADRVLDAGPIPPSCSRSSKFRPV